MVGVAALAQLPETCIEIGGGDPSPLEALKGLVRSIAEMQVLGLDQDPEYAGVRAEARTPFAINYGGTDGFKFDVLVDIGNGVTGDYEVTPVGAVDDLGIESIGRLALGNRRDVDVAMEYVDATTLYTVQSALAVLEFVGGLEDKALSTGNATGTVTLATVLAGSTVTINGLVYTAVTGAKADNTEFSIDGTDTVDAADLADSINNDVRTGTYGDVSATSALGVVTVTQTLKGEEGNATTLAEDTTGTTIVVSGATLTGAGGNGTYSNISLGSNSNPFSKRYVWTVSKADNVYTITPTADS